MGDFGDLIREGLEIVDELTEDLQGHVRVFRYASQSLTGTSTYSPQGGTLIKAFVDYEVKEIRTESGKVVMTKAWIMFPRPQLLGPKDKIVLPNGQSGPILTSNGFLDAATSEAFYREVYLG